MTRTITPESIGGCFYIPIDIENNRDYREEITVAKEVCRDYIYSTLASLFAYSPSDIFVIARYSALPNYRRLWNEVTADGKRLINTPEQHNFVADITNYVSVLRDLTPTTYTNYYNLPRGSYVVKGKTNSAKWNWDTHMFAPTEFAVPKVAARLLDNPVIAEQGIVVRDYVPLKKVGEGINGLPISMEYRVFVLFGEIVASGFYWAIIDDEKLLNSSLPPKALELVRTVIERVGKRCSFYVIDVAQTREGKWIVVELNDGQMSGLSTIPPKEFYMNICNRFTTVHETDSLREVWFDT